jgi:hypothetical protein
VKNRLTIVSDEEECIAIYLDGRYIGKADQVDLAYEMECLGLINKIVVDTDWVVENGWPDELTDVEAA